MNKTELIEAIATRSKTTKAQTALMLDELLEVIQKTLVESDNVQLVGFGSFSVTERASREGRNPSTGELMVIPSKKVVKFKRGKGLSDVVSSVKKTSRAKPIKPKNEKKK